MPDLHQDVLIDLRRIMRAADIYSRRLGRESGLTTPQLVVLRAILDHGNPTVSQISKDVSLSQATVTSMINPAMGALWCCRGSEPSTALTKKKSRLFR